MTFSTSKVPLIQSGNPFLMGNALKGNEKNNYPRKDNKTAQLIFH